MCTLFSGGFDESAAVPRRPSAEHENARKSFETRKAWRGFCATEYRCVFRVRLRRFSCLFVFSLAGTGRTGLFRGWIRPVGFDETPSGEAPATAPPASFASRGQAALPPAGSVLELGRSVSMKPTCQASAEKPIDQVQRPFVCPCRPEGRFCASGGNRRRRANEEREAPPIRRSGSGSLAARSFNLFHFVRADLRTRDILSTTGQNLETIMLCDIAKAMKTVLPFIYKGLLVSNEISRRRCRKKRRRCRRVIDRRC